MIYILYTGALFGLGLLLRSVHLPIDGTLPMPVPVRWSFILFVVIFLSVAGLLISRVPNVIPWRITPELSVVIGWMFLGAATYFAYALLRPSWVNAAGQLVGFLAYDLVLIVPFLTRLPTVAPEHRIGLIVHRGLSPQWPAGDVLSVRSRPYPPTGLGAARTSLTAVEAWPL